MPDLNFRVSEAAVPPYAAAPQIHFKLDITNSPESESIHAVILQCQIQIESVKRAYTDAEREKLDDLFGDPERWGQTLRNKLWTHAQVSVPPFIGSTTVNLPVTCTYDMNVVGTKYFYALESGEVSLLFLFSGTVFYESEDGRLQVSQISWDKESGFRLPVQMWHEMIECYYPNTAWIVLQRDIFERLYSYKRKHGLPTWEQTIDRLLPETGATLEP